MLRPRITPCLLIQNDGLVKTQQFTDPKYVGDPINAVKIFNEKEVDELIVLDIDASVLGREPNYALIRSLANECRMPLCYGGGVKTVEQIERIIQLGVEKVAISSAAITSPSLISVGLLRRLEIFIENGKTSTGLNPSDFVIGLEALGAGEVVINSIDRDGQMQGYDLDLIEAIRKRTTLPLTVLGGAGSLGDIQDLIEKFGIIGAAAGSLFVFKGKYRAVLINYPSRSERDAIIRAVLG